MTKLIALVFFIASIPSSIHASRPLTLNKDGFGYASPSNGNGRFRAKYAVARRAGNDFDKENKGKTTRTFDTQKLKDQNSGLKLLTTLRKSARQLNPRAEKQLHSLLTKRSLAKRYGLKVNDKTKQEGEELLQGRLVDQREWAVTKFKKQAKKDAEDLLEDLLKTKGKAYQCRKYNSKKINTFFNKVKNSKDPHALFIALLLLNKNKYKSLMNKGNKYKHSLNLLHDRCLKSVRQISSNQKQILWRDIEAKKFFEIAKNRLSEWKKEIALQYFLTAAALGHVDAMFKAAFLLEETDKAEALKWYIKAAEKGNAKAMFNTGVLLDDGFDDEEPNIAEALKWYRKAAALGNKNAMYNAGLSLEGDFDAEALMWYRKAAEMGDVDAMFRAGLLSEKTGKIDEALELYKESAAQGNIGAMVRVGLRRFYQFSRTRSQRYT